jgi:L-malate glycosyltransferase
LSNERKIAKKYRKFLNIKKNEFFRTIVTPILLMVRELGPGGTERQLTELARSLDRSRFEVHVACFHEGIRAAELRALDIPIVRFPIRSFLKPGVLLGAWQLRQYIRRHRIQIVHTFDYPLNCFGVPVSRAAGAPIVISSQRAHRSLTPPVYLRVLRLTDRLVNGIVVNSESVRRSMIEQERLPASLLHLCYNGIDTTRFHPGGRDPLASLVIGVVCVLRPEKGLQTLLEAFAQALRQHPNIHLVIVGSGPELPQLQRLAQELGLNEHCQFQPATAEVAAWLQSINIFVLPSLSEALSNSLMEAMACGCACIASRTGGNPELIRHEETGLLFEPGDANDLTKRLLHFIENPALRTRLARTAVQTIRERFSLPASVSRMQEIYETLLNPTTTLKSLDNK